MAKGRRFVPSREKDGVWVGISINLPRKLKFCVSLKILCVCLFVVFKTLVKN